MVEPRAPKPTVRFVDEYCQWYQALFPEVRSFEAFKYFHVGMISEIRRKSLPAIARVTGLNNEVTVQGVKPQAPEHLAP